MSDFLDDLKALRQLDRTDMLGKVTALAQMCREGWELGLSWDLPRGFSRQSELLILGMGGSAIGGDLLQGLAGDSLGQPLCVNRTYTVPNWVSSRTLVAACSYSGNTEETLSALEQAAAAKAKIAVLTSGGKLKDWATSHRAAVLEIPAGLPPRTALGYLTFAPLGMLVRLGWLKKPLFDMKNGCRELKAFIAGRLAPSVKRPNNPAKQIAMKLKGRLPVLYGAAGGWEGITYRWRTQLEENAKTLAFHHLFPEATHNEISGWVHPKALLPRMEAVFITDPAVHPRTRRRMEFAARIVRRQGAGVLWAQVPGPTALSRMLRLIALGDFVSVYLAFLYRVDPTPVRRVEALKRFMRRP